MAPLASICCALFFTSLVAATPAGGRIPPQGWSTWCTGGSCGQPGRSGNRHDVCNEFEIKTVATAMSSNGMLTAGYDYIMLDDCWGSVERTSDGHIAADADRFPSGMAELASWLHRRDFKLGLYMTAGNETCSTGGRDIPGEPDARGIPGSCSAGPPTVDSCTPEYKRDIDDVASWGVDAVKMDWCRFNTTAGGPPTSVSNLTSAFGSLLAESGRPMAFNYHCEASWAPWCPLVGGTELATRSWRIYKDHHDEWSSTSSIIDVLGRVANHSSPHAFGDPDFLLTGGAGCDEREYKAGVRCPGQTEVEYRTEFSLWVIAAAPLIVATDLRLLTPFMTSTLMHDEMLAIARDTLVTSLGVIQTQGACQTWGRRISGNTATVAVALFNGGNSSSSISFSPAILFTNGTTDNAVVIMPDSVMIRNVWERRDLGTFAVSHTIIVEVASHATEVFMVTVTPTAATNSGGTAAGIVPDEDGGK